MNPKQLIVGALASTIAVNSIAFVNASHARSAAVIREDGAQIKADEASLAWERARLQSDLNAQAQDMRSGRLSATSHDAERVYDDWQAINGETRVIAAEKPDSLQLNSDQAALQRDKLQLAADSKTLKADTRAGRMAAMSPDDENVYQDEQAIEAQQHVIALDRAKLKADEHS